MPQKAKLLIDSLVEQHGRWGPVVRLVNGNFPDTDYAVVDNAKRSFIEFEITPNSPVAYRVFPRKLKQVTGLISEPPHPFKAKVKVRSTYAVLTVEWYPNAEVQEVSREGGTASDPGYIIYEIRWTEGNWHTWRLAAPLARQARAVYRRSNSTRMWASFIQGKGTEI